MGYWRNQDDENIDFRDLDESEDYTKHQLEVMTNQILKEDSKREMCRKCGKYGEETGEVKPMAQWTEDGDPVTDDEGHQLWLDFPMLKCEEQHEWALGEGKGRGIGGENPILFEEHIQSRKRREIYVTVGIPDPAIEAGLYNRTHKDGRKVNSDRQRRINGASFYR